MKKLIALTLIVACVSCFSLGCKKEAPAPATDPAATTPGETTTPAEGTATPETPPAPVE